RGGGGRGGGAGGGCGGRSCGKPAGVVGMSPRGTTRPSAASITNTLRLLCTSSPTYASIGLPSSLRLGRNATPWSAVDLTAAEGSPPSSLRDGGVMPSPLMSGSWGGDTTSSPALASLLVEVGCTHEPS